MPSFAFLVHLLPELVGRFPDLAISMQDDLPALARRQPVLFHDLLLGLQALTELHQTPLVLVLEDLHWADETSLELLTYLARRLDMNSLSSERSTPLLILGTYRTEALVENPALQHLVWHLQALRQLTELPLAPLNMTDHRRCISSILDQTIPEEFADFLFQWDEGNPFYAEELLGAMAATGYLQAKPHGQGWFLPHQNRPPLPSSITAAILERFVRLPAMDQQVLTMASIIGRTFDFLLLATVCDLDEQALVDVLGRAISRQFLGEVTTTTSLGFAKLSLAQGKHEQVQDWYESTLAYWQTTEEMLFILPILLDGLTFYTQIGNLQQAKRWLAHLQQVTIRTDNPVGKAALLEGQGIIAVQQKKPQPALEALRQAVQAWGDLKFRYRQAVVAHHLAELLLQQGERKTMDHKTRQHLREEAEGFLHRAVLVYEELGIADQAEAVRRLRGHTRLDAQQKRRRALATHRQAGGLTPRELQTLQLLAAGLPLYCPPLLRQASQFFYIRMDDQQYPIHQ